MNAAGHDEKIVRIEVPEEREDPQPLVVDVRMEPTKTADSTVSTGHYTYWVLNGNRVDDATDAAAADKTTVVLREPPTMGPEEEYRDRTYVVVTNDVDDVDLQLMQPPMPVSSFSAAAASTVVSSDDNRFCYRVTTMITLVLAMYYVSAYSRR